MQTHKGLKLAIKLLTFLLFITCVNSYGQSNKDDYIILHKIISLNKKPNDSIFKLRQRRGSLNKENFKKYYGYRYLKEKTATMIIGYDEEKDSLIELSGLDQKKYEKSRFSTYIKIDNFLTKKDFKSILAHNGDLNWDSDKLNADVKVINDLKLSYRKGYGISNPYYSLDNKYALVQLSFPSNTPRPTLYIFKKEENKWKIIKIMDNFWQ